MQPHPQPEPDRSNSPQTDAELQRASSALSIACWRYSIASPWLIGWQVDQTQRVIFTNFDLGGASGDFEKLFADNEKVKLIDLLKALNSGSIDPSSGFEFDQLHHFRIGVSALISLSDVLKCSFPDGLTCSREPWPSLSFRLEVNPVAIRSLQHLEYSVKEIEGLNGESSKRLASSHLVSAVLTELVKENGFHVDVSPLDPRPEWPSLLDFSITLCDPSGEEKITPEVIEKFYEQLKHLELEVSKVTANDPVHGDLILMGDRVLRTLVLERGLNWGIY